jgi:hypothetical protein
VERDGDGSSANATSPFRLIRALHHVERQALLLAIQLKAKLLRTAASVEGVANSTPVQKAPGGGGGKFNGPPTPGVRLILGGAPVEASPQVGGPS